jgi:hypothetical protein
MSLSPYIVYTSVYTQILDLRFQPIKSTRYKKEWSSLLDSNQ